MKKSEKAKPWEPTEVNLTSAQIQEARELLVSTYHSYVQTNAGYMIAVIIGFFALLSSFEKFFVIWYGIVVFGVLVILDIVVAIYVFLRILYWSCHVNYAIFMTEKDIRKNFQIYNSSILSPYEDKAPNTAVLSLAIYQRYKDEEHLSTLQKHAFAISENRYIFFGKKKSENKE